jgi:hypothetical protein
MVQSRDSHTRKILIEASSRIKLFPFDPRSADLDHYRARHGFSALRELARDAAPQLCALLSDPDPDVQECAVRCLLGIGQDARGALETALRSSDTNVSSTAENALAILDGDPNLQRGSNNVAQPVPEPK